MEDLIKEIKELNGIIKDYEDIVDEKDEEIKELKSVIQGVEELISQINRMI